jgi:hypothetical protein
MACVVLSRDDAIFPPRVLGRARQCTQRSWNASAHAILVGHLADTVLQFVPVVAADARKKTALVASNAQGIHASGSREISAQHAHEPLEPPSRIILPTMPDLITQQRREVRIVKCCKSSCRLIHPEDERTPVPSKWLEGAQSLVCPRCGCASFWKVDGDGKKVGWGEHKPVLWPREPKL